MVKIEQSPTKKNPDLDLKSGRNWQIFLYFTFFSTAIAGLVCDIVHAAAVDMIVQIPVPALLADYHPKLVKFGATGIATVFGLASIKIVGDLIAVSLDQVPRPLPVAEDSDDSEMPLSLALFICAYLPLGAFVIVASNKAGAYTLDADLIGGVLSMMMVLPVAGSLYLPRLLKDFGQFKTS